jgi:hypothetical protein
MIRIEVQSYFTESTNNEVLDCIYAIYRRCNSFSRDEKQQQKST